MEPNFMVPLLPGDSSVITPPDLAGATRSAESYASAEKASATRRAYDSDFRHFSAWCRGVGSSALPAAPDMVAAYLAALADAGLTAATISRRLAAICYTHRASGHDDPGQRERVRQVVRGIRRTLGTAPKQKAPATARFIKAMLKACPSTIFGARDRAVLLIGFAGAMRRSELVALDVSDIERHPEGLLLHLRRSKTDQEGAGRIVAVPLGTKLKPVAALDAWLRAANISSGPVFRAIQKGGRILPDRLTTQSVAAIVKHRASLAKLDPALFAAHSLRAGFVTSALEDGADALKVMDVTGHRSVDTLKKYDRRAKAFAGHAGKGFL